MTPYSTALADSVQQVLRLLDRQAYPPLTENPVFWHRGRQGASSDASASSVAQELGWGVHVMGVTTQGVWTQATRHAIQTNLIFINPLELLGAAIMLQFLAEHRLWPEKGNAR